MSERDPIRRRVFGSLVMNAVLRWESLVTLVVTMFLFFGVPSPEIFNFALPAWLLSLEWLPSMFPRWSPCGAKAYRTLIRHNYVCGSARAAG